MTKKHHNEEGDGGDADLLPPGMSSAPGLPFLEGGCFIGPLCMD